MPPPSLPGVSLITFNCDGFESRALLLLAMHAVHTLDVSIGSFIVSIGMFFLQQCDDNSRPRVSEAKNLFRCGNSEGVNSVLHVVQRVRIQVLPRLCHQKTATGSTAWAEPPGLCLLSFSCASSSLEWKPYFLSYCNSWREWFFAASLCRVVLRSQRELQTE